MHKWLLALVIGLLAGLTAGEARGAHQTFPEVLPSGGWRNLAAPSSIWPGAGAVYYSFALPGGSRAHLVVVDMNHKRWQIRPALANPATSPTAVVARQENASAATNGGYFNLKGDTGASASYVVIDGKTVADPHTNKTLMNNPKLRDYIKAVLNRSEVRFLQDKQGKTLMQIARHNEPLPPGTILVHSLQAGPRLLPAIDAREEAFIRTNADGSQFDAISAGKPAARTAFGITADGYALMLAVAGKGQDPEGNGITLEELASLLKRLGCTDAINLDGGASTTMFVKLSPTGDTNTTPIGTVVCGKQPHTLVKSILMLAPIPN